MATASVSTHTPEGRTTPQLLEQAQRLRERLTLAAHHTGLTSAGQAPDLASKHTLANPLVEAHAVAPPTRSLAPPPRTPEGKRKAPASSPSADLYQGVLGSHVALASPSSTHARSMASPPSPTPRVRPTPRTPQSRTSAGELLNYVASSPQLGSPHRRATSDIHNYPSAEQLQRERRAAQRVSPKRRRMDMSAPFAFPTRALAHSPPHLRSGRVASALAQDLGVHTDASPGRLAAARGVPSRHARYASTSSLPDAPRDTHYVPVRSYDPPPHDSRDGRASRHQYSQSVGGTPGDTYAPLSYARQAPAVGPAPAHDAGTARRADAAWAPPPAARMHRRSVSHNVLDTPVPVSHDRHSSIVTPPSESPLFPMTPKSLAPTSRYSDLLSTSPTPQPRHGRPPRAVPSSAPPKAPRHLRFRSEDLGARGARPLWAQSLREPPAPWKDIAM
ncbi:hypothetical protein MBRA1_000977 [Malassezia brasiliensis]|uniref:Uncharacterized protein n=1 Tax=Malassezia brasiliensis TaxID=1821822 RepID=A0AAF0DS13_9BASI|nr:hypothetical protein MBRA1_000977 [Malassezia brasiliensis]